MKANKKNELREAAESLREMLERLTPYIPQSPSEPMTQPPQWGLGDATPSEKEDRDRRLVCKHL